MYEMELKPGSQRNMLAMTGVITSTTIKNTLITMLQDMEYIHGQLFERSVRNPSELIADAYISSDQSSPAAAL